MSARPQPPLFVECYGTRTPEPVRGVVDSKSSVSLEPGRWQCEISAPNGVRATVQMEAKDGRISGDEMARRLLKRAHVDDLWIEPKSARVTLSDDAVMLGAWSNGRQLDADQFHVVELDRDGRHRRIRVATEGKGRIDHIQVAIEGGASIVMRYPDRGQLHFQVDSASETPIRAVVDGLDPAISAYWGFTRHAVVRGAYELGRRLAERLEQSELSTDELVVLAHWLTTHAIDDFELSALTRSALASAMQTPDVRIMRWILLARRGREANTATVLTEFVGLLGAIKKQPPLYTETLRLFTHHLTSAVAQLREHSPEEHEQAEESLRWVWSLASAMTWDTEHTGYRALAPGTPDPKALTVHISERAKKKSAGWRPLL